MRRALLAMVLVGTASAGCGHTETHVAMLRAPQPRTEHAAELYVADQAAPTRPYFEIALVQAVGYGNEATPEAVTRALTERAATLGCDAVVRTFIDLGYSRAHAAGVCVKYLTPGPPGPAPELPAAGRPLAPPRPQETLPSTVSPPLGPPSRGVDQR
jgi:hypothetical protein